MSAETRGLVRHNEDDLTLSRLGHSVIFLPPGAGLEPRKVSQQGPGAADDVRGSRPTASQNLICGGICL